MGRTTTGYYLRKMVDESHDVIAYSGGIQPLTIMRYAEVLLNKAEACYRLDQTGEANTAVKAVRTLIKAVLLSGMQSVRRERWNSHSRASGIGIFAAGA